MEHIQIARLTLNNQYHIISHNSYFSKLFNYWENTTKNSSNNTHIKEIIKSPEIDIIQILNTLNDGKCVSHIIFKNIPIKDRTQQGLLLIYLQIKKVTNEYYFEMVNWITWLHYIHKSLDNGYLCINNFHSPKHTSNFKAISDIYCLKAFHPLLAHIPSRHFEFVNHRSLYNIMRSFIKLRKDKKSKDYSRNAYSRINTSIKEEFGIIHLNQSIGLFLNKSLVSCIRNGEMCIPNTSLHNELLIPITKDNLLEHIIRTTPIDHAV